MAQARTIAVAYASVGSGHRVAAEAVAAEIGGRNLDGVQVELVDVLDGASRRLSGNSLATMFTGSTAGIYDAVWSSRTVGAASRAVAAPLLNLFFPRFLSRIEELSPDLVIATHGMASLLTRRLIRSRGADAPLLANVATDFGIHTFWPTQDVTLFCVADSDSKEQLAARGFEPEQIAVTGVPVRQQFALEYDREAALKHFELPSERRIVLALAGSTMPGPYERFKEALAVALPALASLPNTSVVVVCGRDDLFAEEMRTRAAGFGTTNVRVLGFVEHMAPLMACADLALAKPGGSICAESIAMNVPLVLVGPAAGQENANAKALTAAGAALFAADPRMIAEYVRKAAANPARAARMRESSATLARPFAAADVADRALGLLGVSLSEEAG